jgi:hypothetical protein
VILVHPGQPLNGGSDLDGWGVREKEIVVVKKKCGTNAQ